MEQELNIAIMTPWKVRCGFYHQSKLLADHLSSLGVTSYIVRHKRMASNQKPYYQRLFDRVKKLYEEKGVRVLIILHEYHYFGQGKYCTWFYPKLKAELPELKVITIRNSKPVMPASDEAIDKYSDVVVILNETYRYSDKETMIRHGSEIRWDELIPKEEARKKLGIKTPYVIMFHGFVDVFKNIDRIIQALEKDLKKDITFIICGGWIWEQETKYIQDLRDMSQGLNVIFTGWVPEDKMRLYFSACDIGIDARTVASASGVALEFGSFGKSMVASDVPTFKEKPWILAFNPDDPKDIRQKVQKLLKNGKLKKDLENKAKEYSKANSWEKQAVKWKKLIESLLKK